VVLQAQLFILVVSIAMSLAAVPSQSLAGMDVVINEFDSNPSSGPQWIELYNPTNFPYSISLWRIITRAYGITYTIPSGSSIPGKGYFYMEFAFPIIDPAGDVVFLQDNNGLEIDRTPPLSKLNRDNMAWARVPNGADTDSSNDWKLQAATKGATNDALLPPPPPPVLPTITCILSSPQIEIGSAATVTIVVGPSRVATITIQTKKAEETTWNNLTTAITDSQGRYSCEWTPIALGAYHVRGYVLPGGTFPEMFSIPISLFVGKIRVQLSSSVTHPLIRLGQDLATYGYLIPAIEGVIITLTYRKPTGSPIIRTVQTGPGGLYNDTAFTPQEAGSWNVTASWEGDETHTTANSPLVRFYVEQPPATIFGVWLIVGIVISVSVGAVLLAAGLTKKTVAKPPRRVALCPTCRSTLLYVPSIRGWYCPRCRRQI
jgi:hypothetical protein